MAVTLEQVLGLVLPLLTPGGEERVGLDEVGRAVGLSPWRAQRVVSAAIGESPARHRSRRRLELAALDLLCGDRRILDVAIDHGYGSHEAFTRAFTRHFGLGPAAYRRQARLDADHRDRQRQVAAALSPCITLYRAGTEPAGRFPQRQEPSVDHTIERRTLTGTPTLHQVRRVDREQLAEALAEMLPAVFHHVMTIGAPMAGVPYVRHLEASPAFVVIEAGIPLAAPAPAAPEAGIEAGSLPGGAAAVTVHVGPYDDLAAAHIALDRWLDANDERAAGPYWESYVTDPGEVPDPAQWRTEVFCPLA